MALARGSSSVKTGPLTLHTKTAIHIAETITRVGEVLELYAAICDSVLYVYTG